MSGETSLAVIASREPPAQERNTATISQLRGALARISALSAEELAELIQAAGAAAAIGKVRQSQSLVREASEVRIRALRRLGTITAAGTELPDGISLRCWELAQIPTAIFDATIADMLSRDLMCHVQHVIENAQRMTLKKVEPGLWQAWDGTYFCADRYSNRRMRSHAKTIDDAREDVRRAAGLSRGWHASRDRAKLDEAHARARRLCQALSLIGDTISGERRQLVAEAELRQAEVAEILFRAYRLPSDEPRNT